MTYRAVLFLMLVSTILGAGAHASDVSLQGGTVTNACGYFSEITANYAVKYHNETLPWGTRVFLVYGENGTTTQYQNGQPVRTAVEWQNRQETEASAVSPYTWGVQVSHTIEERTEPYIYGPLAFVFRIELPNGQTTYDNGGQSTWGYYLGSAPAIAACQENPGGTTPMSSLNVTIVNR